MNQSEIENFANVICNKLSNMVKSMVPTNLENVIDYNFSEKGEDDMGVKFKERVKINTDGNGNPIYAWASGNTKEELHQSIAALLNQASKPEIQKQEPPKVAQSNSKWEDCAQQWFDVFHLPKVRPKTAVKDKSLLNKHIKPAFAGKNIDAITTMDVQQFLQTKENYCKTLVRDIMWMMKAIFAAAREDGKIDKNPMDSERICNPSKKEAKERKALSTSEQADIVNHLDDLKDKNARLFMSFLMFTCLRPCEIYGLTWEDINFDERVIYVHRDLVFVSGASSVGETKTKESKRVIPVDEKLIEILTPLRSTGYVIGENGQHVTSEAIARKIWNYIKCTIDVHGMTPYIGRHTYATNMSRAGISIKTAMKMMGHKDERMLLRTYTHVCNEDLLNACKAVSEYTSDLRL